MTTITSPKYRILVVDDDLDLNTGFALLLEFEGHKVQTTYTGEAALEKLAKSEFDLIIAEYWLPRMRGDQFAAMVKERWPDIPIIMVTAKFEDIHVDDHPIPGVNCLLDKPFSMDQLREAMSWTMGYRTGRQVQEPPPMEVHWVHTRNVENAPNETPSDRENYR